MNDDFKLGPTGRFPEGKISDDDQGELRAAVGVNKGQVIIDFGKPVSWLAIPPDGARGLAVALIQKAAAIDGKIFTIEL